MEASALAAARETAETEDGDAESKHKQAGKHSKRLPNRHVIHVKLSQDLSLGGGCNGSRQQREQKQSHVLIG